MELRCRKKMTYFELNLLFRGQIKAQKSLKHRNLQMNLNLLNFLANSQAITSSSQNDTKEQIQKHTHSLNHTN